MARSVLFISIVALAATCGISDAGSARIVVRMLRRARQRRGAGPCVQ
jgi:hypothetical protein